MDTTIPLISSPLPSITITPPAPPPAATSPPPSSPPPSPPPPPLASPPDTIDTPPNTIDTPPPSPPDTINTPPNTINTPPPSPQDTINTPPNTIDTPPPSPPDTINTPPITINTPPPPPPETPNAPPPASPPPPPPETTFSPPEITFSPPEITFSPPEPHAESPKKSHPPKKSPFPPHSLVPPPSPGSATPPPHAMSPYSSISLSPPSPLTTSSVTAVSSNNGANNGSGMKTGNAAGIGIGVGFVALVLVVLAVFFKRKRKRNVDGLYANYVLPSLASSQKSDSSFLKPQNSAYLSVPPSRTNSMYSLNSGNLGNSRSCFTYEELTEATKGFSKQNILGEGGFGCVYKGVLVDGREVAVKQLKAGGGQGEREFRAEVEIISRVHHRHLVSLVGYCISEHQRLLVYDFVSNDTLDYHLHDFAGEGRPVMGWATRVRVAAGAARGLAYLHEDCHPRIIHRDIKSSNILLDTNFEAQVADFGLAKLAMDTNTHVSTRVMGTFGYLAPEYATSGKVTEKSDVYSFGVVLLELITGRKPVDTSQPYGDESLVEWARPLLTEALERDDFEELIDSRLGKNYDAAEVFRMIEAAASCVRHSALKRPRMSQVVRSLDSLDEISGISNGAKPGESVILDSREQSAQIRMFQKTAFGTQEFSSDYF